MPRIQILHLPGPADEYPFAVVIDEWSMDPQLAADVGASFASLKEDMGAATVLVFEETVDIP